MSGIHWQLAGPDARLRDYEPCVLLVYDDARSRILKVAGDADGRQLRVTSPMARLPLLKKNSLRMIPTFLFGDDRRIGGKVSGFSGPGNVPASSAAVRIACLRRGYLLRGLARPGNHFSSGWGSSAGDQWGGGAVPSLGRTARDICGCSRRRRFSRQEIPHPWPGETWCHSWECS